MSAQPPTATVRLWTLGQTDLRNAEGEEVLSVLSQPKRLALLTYLAVATPNGFTRRDRLAALFWPELDQEHARSNLRKSLWYLRKSLGKGVLTTRGDEEVGVSREALWCDVTELLSAAAQGDAEGANRLARGQFLDAFHVRGASNEWDDWIEAKRSEVERTLWALAEPGASTARRVDVPEAEPSRHVPFVARQRMMVGAVASFGVVSWLVWLGAVRDDSAAPSPIQFTVPLPTSGTLATGQWMDISPDGQTLAFNGRRSEGEPIQIRALSATTARPLPGSEGGRMPFFSSDGEWVGFAVPGGLGKARVDGGDAVAIVDGLVQPVRGASWGLDGTIVIGQSRSPLARLTSGHGDGGSVREQLTDLGEGEISHGYPEFLPGRNAILFEIEGRGSPPELAVLDLDERVVERLGYRGWTPKYSPGGEVVYADADGALHALPFDLERLEARGPPRSLGVTVNRRPTGADFDISVSGTLIHIPPYELPHRLVRVRRDGSERPLTREWRAYAEPRVSPEGGRIAFSVLEGPLRTIWLYHLADDRLEQLTQVFARRPYWHPRGEELGYSGRRQPLGPVGVSQLGWTAFLMPVHGVGGAAQLDDSSAIHGWSRDGEWRLRSLGYYPPLWAENVISGRRIPLDRDAAKVSFSPDGNWLIFESAASGEPEVYVQRFPALGTRYKVSESGGTDGVWSPSDRDEVFYIDGGELVSASVSTEPDFAVLDREILFEFPYLRYGPERYYDPFPDGESFVAIRQGEPGVEIVMSVGWLEALSAEASR